MVRLTKIYTRMGDGGATMLGDGSFVPKHHCRVEAYGTVDEANAAIAMIVSAIELDAKHSIDEKTIRTIHEELLRIQNDLFDVGADLCVPLDEKEDEEARLRVTTDQVVRLEQSIDRYNDRLSPLNSFILPGGTNTASHLHLARTICRRAERAISLLIQTEPEKTNSLTMVYMNRLSDLLFVLARVVNNWGGGDVLWKPGAHRNTNAEE